jgi:tetratricopeptide (TPR) repeat protein/serine/threonine protein kinase
MATERVHIYETLEPAPRSGPGQAFRARVAAPGGPLAEGSIVQLRVVSETEAGGPGVLRELEREHSAAQRIRSPAVAAPADFGLADGPDGRRFWSVTPWVGGRTLTDVLAGAGSLPDPFVDAIAKQTADGLTAIHRAGLSAIGLSPDKLLVQDDTSIQILDPAFGPAHAAARPAAGPTPGPFACAAPEAIRDRAHSDERADLYSLGATLFRAMTGRWHRPDDAQALACEPDSFPARRPSDVHPRLSVFLDELVFALVQPDRAKRFASFAELVRILEERRESAWWQSLNIAQESYDEARTERPRPASEPLPTPIPSPAPAPDASWVAEHRKRGFRLARHPARLVDREDELTNLVDAASRLRERGGQVRLIQGGPGAGKTRLVDALFDALENVPGGEGPMVLAGEHRRLGIGRPMRAFTEAIMRIVTDGRDVAPAQISPLLGDAAAIAGAFAAFLSGSEPPEKSLPLTRDAIVGAFSRAFGSLCATTPVVLVIENLQWADPEALDLFEELARLTSQLPLLVVGTFQPVAKTAPLSDVLASLRALDHVATIRIEPFAETETQQLVLNLVAPDERAVALSKRIHRVCEGSGTRIVETVRLLEAEGSLVRDAAGRLCAVTGTAAAEMPATEEAMWSRRIGRLGAGDRAVLSMAAVQGYAFDADVVRLALGFSSLDMDRSFESLGAAAMIEGTGLARRFSSNSLFDYVHDALEDAAHAQGHESTANAFLASRNPEGRPPAATHGMLSYRVAWHYLLAGKATSGLLYVEPAMRHLRSTWRLGDAERLAELAARTLAADPDRTGELVDMLLTRAEFLGHQDRRAEQRDVIDEALLRSRGKGDSMREALALYESARLRFVEEELHTAVIEAREALVAAQKASADRVVTNCQALLGAIAFREARYQEARNHVNEMLAMARRRSDPGAEAEALYTLGNISQGVGSFEHAEELHRTAMHIYRQEGDLEHEADALASLGSIAAASGDLVKAEGMLRRALAIERAVGDGHSEARVLGRLGMVLQETQRYEEARAVHNECLQVSRRIHARHNEVVALLNLATVDYVLGLLDDARSNYGDAMRAARELRDARLQGYALMGLGEVGRQCGESGIARGLFERAVSQFRRCDDQGGLAAALLGAGRVEIFGGDAARGQSFLTEARDLAVLQNARYAGALAVAYLALLAARRGAAEDSLAGMAESGAMVEGVRAGDTMRLELLFLHAMTLRVLKRKVEGDRKMCQAELALVQATAEMPAADRERVCAAMSPHREILAGAALARESSKSRDGTRSGTVPV